MKLIYVSVGQPWGFVVEVIVQSQHRHKVYKEDFTKFWQAKDGVL